MTAGICTACGLKMVRTSKTTPPETARQPVVEKSAVKPVRKRPAQKNRMKGLEIFEKESGADENIDLMSMFESTGHEPNKPLSKKRVLKSRASNTLNEPTEIAERPKPGSQRRGRPGPSGKQTKIAAPPASPTKTAPLNQKAKVRQKASSKTNSEQSEDGSMLHLMEDMSEAAGAHYARQDQKQVEIQEKLELVQRSPFENDRGTLTQKQKEIEVAYKKLQAQRAAEATGDLIPKEELSKRRNKVVFLSIIPQIILLVALIIFGMIFVNTLYFQGKWIGQVFDETGREVGLELQIDRFSNEITGSAYFIRPAGETPATMAQNSKIPLAVLEVMDVMKGTIAGSFNRNKASFVISPESQNNSMSIKFSGEFKSKDELSGTIVNNLNSKGSFAITRIIK